MREYLKEGDLISASFTVALLLLRFTFHRYFTNERSARNACLNFQSFLSAEFVKFLPFIALVGIF